jgi:hypothetical protein
VVVSTLGKEGMDEAAGTMVLAVAVATMPTVVAAVPMPMVAAVVTTALAGCAVTTTTGMVDMALVAAAMATTVPRLLRDEDTTKVLDGAMRVTAVDVGIKVMALVVLEAAVILSRGNQVGRLVQVSMEIGIMLMIPFRGEAILLATTVDTEETSKGGVQGVVVPW